MCAVQCTDLIHIKFSKFVVVLVYISKIHLQNIANNVLSMTVWQKLLFGDALPKHETKTNWLQASQPLSI